MSLREAAAMALAVLGMIFALIGVFITHSSMIEGILVIIIFGGAFWFASYKVGRGK